MSSDQDLIQNREIVIRIHSVSGRVVIAARCDFAAVLVTWLPRVCPHVTQCLQAPPEAPVWDLRICVLVTWFAVCGTCSALTQWGLMKNKDRMSTRSRLSSDAEERKCIFTQKFFIIIYSNFICRSPKEERVLMPPENEHLDCVAFTLWVTTHS